MMDISKLSLPELRALERQIPREIRRRASEEKNNVRNKLKKLAEENGFTLAELLESGRSAPRTPRVKGVAKYRHPQQSDLTWSGHGRKPRWMEEWLAKGGSLEQLAV